MRKISPAGLRLLRAPLLILGVVLFAFGVWGLVTDVRYLTSGAPIRATIVRLTDSPGGKHHPVIQYRVGDAIYEQISISSNAGPQDVGKTKELRYLRDKPGSTREGFRIWIDLLLCALGIALLAGYRSLRRTPRAPAG